MTTLAVDTPRTRHETNLDVYDQVEAVGSDIIFQGAAVGADSSGFAGPLLTAGATIFLGIALAQCDNSAGASGDKRVELLREGLVRLTIAGATRADVLKSVYATDDDTFTLTKSGSAICVGWVFSCNVAGSPLVYIRGAEAGKPSASVADPSGGATVDAESRTAIGSIIDALEAAGILDPA